MPSIRHFALAAVAALAATPLALAAKFAVIATSAGPIVVELDDEKAPITVENFERYAKDGYYDATVFHRVIPGFMIQGGDPKSRDRDPTNDGTGGGGSGAHCVRCGPRRRRRGAGGEGERGRGFA